MPPVIIPRSKPDLRGPRSAVRRVSPRPTSARRAYHSKSLPDPSLRCSVSGFCFRRSLATLLRNLGLPGRNDRASGLRSVSAFYSADPSLRCSGTSAFLAGTTELPGFARSRRTCAEAPPHAAAEKKTAGNLGEAAGGTRLRGGQGGSPARGGRQK